MKHIAQYQDGRIEIQEVPEPQAPPGGIVVRVTHSVISPGTERMKVEQAKMNLLQKAMARPDQVKKVLQTAKTLGWKSALEKVRNRLGSPTPLGYSLAGIVESVAPDCTEFRVGQAVACGGAECAFHAEKVGIPAMLAAVVPDGVPLEDAAYTTLASIALHGVRQLEGQIGERVVIYGQGLVGLLCTALCRAAGIRVMAIDVKESKLALAKSLGAELAINGQHSSVADEVRDWTGGMGIDGILLCAGGGDSSRMATEFATVLRDRGRLVIVGIADVELPWREYYAKEIEVRWSRSYGPGRYDPAYEWGGSDYPPGYVRWTEQRNFQACLHLMQEGRLPVGLLTTRSEPFEQALSAYQDLARGASEDVGILLHYDNAHDAVPANQPMPGIESTPPSPTQLPQRLTTPVASVDVVGAGNFAKTMLLPYLKGNISLGTVVTQTALNARHTKEKFGFSDCSTDGSSTLSQPGGAVLIATRHNLHAEQVLSALAAGRHIFVEKPLCLTPAELAEITKAVSSSSGSLMVGFNRRFAPATQAMQKHLGSVNGPKSLNIRVNAGLLAPDHWYANVNEAGGRMVGEGCHFFDWACAIIGSRPTRVFAQPLGSHRQPVVDAFAASIEFLDGSQASITYSAEGDPGHPKETATVFAPGLVMEMTNFQEVRCWKKGRKEALRFQSKGHAEEIKVWGDFLRGEKPHPFEYPAIWTSMNLVFMAAKSIQSGSSITL